MNPSGPTSVRGRSLLVLGILACSLMAVAIPGLLLDSNLFSTAFGATGSGDNHDGSNGCQLNAAQGTVNHVIYVQFDNVHFTRDNPNVPSDLEQMPALLNFMEQNGVLFSNHQTPIISHTANDILTSLTGVYPNRLGEAVANSYGYFNRSGTVSFASSFTYWTDKVGGTDNSYNLLTATGQNAPAPWVPFTRAGCNVGAFSTANIELENVGSDINTVFGPTSPQAAEAHSNHDKAVADFEGVSIHCAASSSLCSSANGGVADVLPSEPGGYTGYNALFGAKYVAPLINNGQPMTDLFGNLITDGNGNNGFPGFDPTAAQTLSYVAAMQEHGVPVTYAYIEDAHDNHASGGTFGPGEAGYVAQLASFNTAFADFFARLQHDGITKDNTLFVIGADENDHFVGGLPAPSNCDGVHVACTYSQVGEVDAYLNGLLPTTTPAFSIHFDDAPAFYIRGNPSSTAASTRGLEHNMATLQIANPISGATDTVTQYLADPVELGIMHMVTADPARTPTFVDFANPDYYFTAGPRYDNYCIPPANVCLDSGYAWNHGDIQPQITTTWLGMVGPGVSHNGLDTVTWSDHTDIRPTMMALLGLQDDYTYDGHVIVQALDNQGLQGGFHDPNQQSLYEKLAQTYDQINAPTGQFALTTLAISTHALASNTPGDATYTSLIAQLNAMASQRNSIASQMNSILQGAAQGESHHLDTDQVNSLVSQGQNLLNQANTLEGFLA